MSEIPVTAHAMLRYLTRIEDFDLTALVRRLGRDVGSWRLVRAACDHLGISVENLQRQVLPAHLEPLLSAGVARIGRPGCVLICARGQVVSVVSRRAIACKVLSKNEVRKGQQRMARERRARRGCA